MTSTTISKILGCQTKDFIEDIFGKSRKFNENGIKDHLKSLPTLGSLDDLYYSLESSGQKIGLVDGYASPSNGTPLVRADGRVALDEIHAAYRSGKTLLLTHLQNYNLGVARLTRQIESFLYKEKIYLRKDIGANLFLTPPISQGFTPHYDGHDVLILQLAGEKIWNTFEIMKKIKPGMEGERVSENELPPAHRPIKLRKGDVLYIPRGMPHFARTNQKNSLHLTLSIIPLTWSDIFKHALTERIDIDKNIDKSKSSPNFKISASQVERAKSELTNMWLESLPCLPEIAPWNSSTQPSQIGVRLTKELITKLDINENEGSVTIKMPSNTIKVSIEGLEIIRHLLEGFPINPSDAIFKDRPIESRMRFLKSLVNMGLATEIT